MVDRTRILLIIANHVAKAVDGLDPLTIEGQKSMVYYGLNSLDISDAISSIMKELNIKIPRLKLLKLDSIDALADLIVEYIHSGDE